MTLQEISSGQRSVGTRSISIGNSEARVMLRTALGPYCDAGYRQLCEMVGHTASFETTGPSGAAYRLDCWVSQVSPDDCMVTVAGIATEVGSSAWIPEETSLGFSVLPDDTVF
jgi:hypothetical protein